MKVIARLLWFYTTVLCDWLKISRHFLNQSVVIISSLVEHCTGIARSIGFESRSSLNFFRLLFQLFDSTLRGSQISPMFHPHFTYMIYSYSVLRPKPIMAYLHAFSRAWRKQQLFPLSSDWFMRLSPSVVVGQSNYYFFYNNQVNTA